MFNKIINLILRAVHYILYYKGRRYYQYNNNKVRILLYILYFLGGVYYKYNNKL